MDSDVKVVDLSRCNIIPEIPENAVEIRRETCDGNVIKRFSPNKLPICG